MLATKSGIRQCPEDNWRLLSLAPRFIARVRVRGRVHQPVLPRMSQIDLRSWQNRSMFGLIKQAVLGTSTLAKQEHPMGEARKNGLRVDFDRSVTL